MSRETPEIREFTVDELAARAKMTVRNVRAYAGRGLIDSPRLEGRTGYYNRVHLQRLQLIREFLDRGYTLAAVEKAILSNPTSSASHALDLLDVLHQPRGEEKPETMTRDALAALAGVDRDDRLIDSMAELGLVEWLDADSLNVLRPTVVRAGAAAAALGLAPSTVINLLPLLQQHLGAVAEAFVSNAVDEVWQPFVAAGMPNDDWPRILQVIQSLLPVASQAVLGIFREQLEKSIEDALGQQLSELGDPTL